jgi:hypothetical protein
VTYCFFYDISSVSKLYLQVAGERFVLLIVGDITQCAVDVIVSPNDERLKSVDGIAAHILEKGLNMICQIIGMKSNDRSLHCIDGVYLWNNSSTFCVLPIIGITCFRLPINQTLHSSFSSCMQLVLDSNKCGCKH